MRRCWPCAPSARSTRTRGWCRPTTSGRPTAPWRCATSPSSTTSAAGSPGTCRAAASTRATCCTATCATTARPRPNSAGFATTRCRARRHPGLNYYVTGERWIDERVDRYPASHRGGSHGRRFADIEVARALRQPLHGIGPLLDEARALPAPAGGDRGPHRRQPRGPAALVRRGAGRPPSRRVHAGAGHRGRHRLGAVRLVRLELPRSLHERGYYEPGAFDVRSGRAARDRAGRALMREIAQRRPRSHPVLQGQGWWRREGRFLCSPVEDAGSLPVCRPGLLKSERPRPLLITGANGTARPGVRPVSAHDVTGVRRLGPRRTRHLRRRCRRAGDRRAPALGRGQRRRLRPRRRRRARPRRLRMRANALGAAVLAEAMRSQPASRCRPSRATSSSTAASASPYVETDPVAPPNAYGRGKAEAERRVLAAHPGALVVRTSAFFGPWDEANFLVDGLRRLARGEQVAGLRGLPGLRPPMFPALVHARLDLLIDGEAGLRHLCNERAVSWAGWLREAARRCGLEHAETLVVAGPPPNPAAPAARIQRDGEPARPAAADAGQRDGALLRRLVRPGARRRRDAGGGSPRHAVSTGSAAAKVRTDTRARRRQGALALAAVSALNGPTCCGRAPALGRRPCDQAALRSG
ncbi:MAG: sugar nucleotide-binding protein [Comamonadaceae bacterium]|nr:sugar nucleotide-binding protein [Comamonadaceae bacterium]